LGSGSNSIGRNNSVQYLSTRGFRYYMNHREEYDEALDMNVQIFSKPNYQDFRVATDTAWDAMIVWERDMWTERAEFYYENEVTLGRRR